MEIRTKSGRVRSGQARWKGVPQEERTRIARENGVKGANALWAKIRNMEQTIRDFEVIHPKDTKGSLDAHT